ncbi:MAG TPA: M23 family metallopeptidase [Thermoleophilaceae bacterium]|jgi:murein DD-endopeptidase MepM/ murein hydrolase activator NlpD
MGAALCACVAIAAPVAAFADSGGGGAMYVAKPRITKVKCIRRCASHRRARGGSTLRVTGTDLGGVHQMTFHGTYGRADDITAKVRSGSATRLNARVPLGAITGPVSLKNDGGASSRRTRPIRILPAPPPSPNPTLTAVPGLRDAGAPRLETGTSRTKVFVDARRAVVFSYRISGRLARTVRVDLVSAANGAVVKSWSRPSVAPGTVQTISWSGKVGRSGAANGRYSFHVTAQGTDGAIARSTKTSDYSRDSFDLYGNRFPIRGRHDFGGGAGRFGAGRSGHTHQGQDVMARCGRQLIAARGGRVRYSGRQSAAGNYIVIDGAATGTDYAYMHLAEPSPFRKGDRVYTGQRIGSVGRTGDATACHLHFEIWTAPGWYEGGHPVDPLASLKAWDAYS